MKSSKKALLVFSCIIISIIIPISAFLLQDSIDNKNRDEPFALKSASVRTGTMSISYNDYSVIGASSSDYIKWEIDGSPSYVDIIVLVMDSSKYSYFINDVIGLGLATTVSGNYIKLSDGTMSEDSGQYDVPHSSIWYIVFVNLDNQQSSTNLYYKVEWDPIDLAFLNIFSDFPLFFIGVFAVVLSFILCGVVSLSSMNRKPVSTNYKNPYISVAQQKEALRPEEIEYFYCMYCGEKLTKDSVFCSQCGANL